jgi:hypothetical protein
MAGCAGTPGAAPGGPIVATQFDGRYVGHDSLVSGPDFLCGAPSYPETIPVLGGWFYYPLVLTPPRTAPLPVRIAPDGTLSGQMQYGTQEFGPRERYRTAWAGVTGRATGSMLDVTLVNERCVRRLVAQRG